MHATERHGDSLGCTAPAISHSFAPIQTQSTWTFAWLICWVPQSRCRSAVVGRTEYRKLPAYKDSRKAACGCRSCHPDETLQALLEHQEGQQLGLSKLLGAELVPVRGDCLSGSLVRDLSPSRRQGVTRPSKQHPRSRQGSGTAENRTDFYRQSSLTRLFTFSAALASLSDLQCSLESTDVLSIRHVQPDWPDRTGAW
jgi:hypothetical protein